MATRPSNITFDILAKDNASKVFDKMSDKLNAQERALNGLRVAGTAQFVALAAGAGYFSVKSIGAARDLTETVNMTTVLFGDQADAMLEWGDTAYKTVGMSKQAALEASAGFGDMFTQLGFASDQAADMSQTTVQLAADLGSFRDLPTADVIDRISGAMRGEYDSLQKLIPNISTARVQQEALAATGKKVASELTEQDKVTATLAIIQNDAAAASGDFARTSDELAGMQKKLAGVTEDLSARFGTQLLPAVTEVATAGLEALEWMGEHETETKVLAVTVGTLSTAIAVAANWQKIHTTATTLSAGAQWLWNGATTAGNILLGRALPLKAADATATVTSTAAIGSLTAATAANTAVTKASTAATKTHAAALGTLVRGGVIVGGVVAGFEAVSTALESITVETANLTDTSAALYEVAEGGDEASTSLKKITDYNGWDKFVSGGEDINSVADAFARVEESTKGLPKAQVALADFLHVTGAMRGDLVQARETVSSLDEALAAMVQDGSSDKAADAIANLGISADDVRDHLPGYQKALADSEAQAVLLTDATEEQAEATDDAADAVMSLVEALEEQIDKQREAAGLVLDESAAVREFYDAYSAATAGIEENGRTLDVHTEKGRENQAALDEIASSTWDWIDAGVKAGESQFVLTDRMTQGRQAFIDTATQMGATRAEAEAYADELGLIPTAIVTDISLSGASDAYRYITNIQAALRSITGDHRIRVATGQGGSGGLTFAGGGPVSGPGTWTSDSIPAWLSDDEYVHTAQAHHFWGTDAMDAINRRDVSGVLSALIGAGYAGGGSASGTGLPASAMLRPYTGLSASRTSANPASGGSAVFNLYDVDGTLLGSMRGAADDSARFTQQARSAAMRGGTRR
ncbi:hypothetical protein LGT39_12405 [Demequina sp. TTPB684]|uniref:hypothetical protein n=1 Tax=unclassified Demequina TaxID=2620311 RepID=UPI001CF408DE|nr:MULTISPECIES: hypothetical protein [unclassified Demequina]MCB2413646.1 hypothetical protein [Demequina sp. TTPB684]UPU87709.1 hypothetical protein LGT36_010660 [Demequina sp. TMPB413]